MSNIAFQNYIKELEAIYLALAENDTGEPQESYHGGKDSSGIPHGRGILQYSDGSKYEGEFVNGVRQGKGKFHFPVSDPKKRILYEGEWENEVIEGNGSLTFSNGDKYFGEFKNYIQDGFGVYEWANGDKYEGLWKNDLQHGKGVLHKKDDTSSDVEYKDGVLVSGSSCIILPNGSTYKGEIMDGVPHGKGCTYYSNGSKASDCEWKKGKKEGYGITIEGSTVAEGIFKDDKFIKGKRTYNSLNDIKVEEGDFSESTGQLMNGRIIYQYRSYEHFDCDCEVLGGKFTRGTLQDESGSFRGEVIGESHDRPFPINGYTQGFEWRYGELRNHCLNGNGYRLYSEGWYTFKDYRGYVKRIDGNFTNDHPEGEIRITMSTGEQLMGYGDGFGQLTVY
jgi:hypothetical protein